MNHVLSKIKKSYIAIVLLSVLGVFFQNCAEEPNLEKYESQSVAPPPPEPPPLPTPKNCLEAFTNGQLTSGEYDIDPDGNSATPNLRAYCDMSTGGGGWTLILNYVHAGATNPLLDAKTTALPLLKSNILGFDESVDDAAWGHTAPTLLSTLTFTEIRFSCRSNQHQRVVDFKSNSNICINYFKTGTGTCGMQILNPAYNLLEGHNGGNMPALIDAGNANEGVFALTEYPFWATTGPNYEWAIKSGPGADNWECDDYITDPRASTIHRVWVK